jgi:hypothetical protein
LSIPRRREAPAAGIRPAIRSGGDMMSEGKRLDVQHISKRLVVDEKPSR